MFRFLEIYQTLPKRNEMWEMWEDQQFGLFIYLLFLVDTQTFDLLQESELESIFCK